MSTAAAKAKGLGQEVLESIYNRIKDTGFGKEASTGWAGATNLQEGTRDYSHSILDPRFYTGLRKGYKGKPVYKDGKVVDYDVTKARAPIKIEEKPAQFLGAYANRLLTDVGQDSTRRIYWHYNHPMPISDRVSEAIIGQENTAKLKDPKTFTNVQRSAIKLAAVGLPVGASLGHVDVTNPGEQFRAKGFKQKYAEEGSEDRRKTSQIGPELVDRLALGRRGRPLKYATAKEDIPDLTPKRYGDYMRHAYQNKGLTGLGLLKGTMSNLQGYPEVTVVGFPFGLQSAGALAGGSLAMKNALSQPNLRTRGIAGRGFAGGVAGAAVGKLTNMAIASANRPKYPSTLEYYG